MIAIPVFCLGMIYALVGIVLIVAIVWWFLQKVQIPEPFTWVIYAVIAVMLITFVARMFLSGGLGAGFC